MSVTFAEGRREVQDAERRVADARVQAVEARREVRMTRLAVPQLIDTYDVPKIRRLLERASPTAP